MALNVFNAASVLALLFLVGLCIRNYRDIHADRYLPAAGWVRAGIFFCACFIASWLTGTQAKILGAAPATPAQLRDPGWIAWTAGLVVLILVAYWGIWARYTMRFDRKLHLASQITFGAFWGVSMGQLFLIVWSGVGALGESWPDWLVVVSAWASLGVILWVWMVFYWDLYVVPEHDSRYSIALKTVTVHLPQSLLCMIYLLLYDSFAIVAGLQTLALVGASIFMRMPPFSSTEPTPAARRHPFLFGLVYAGGYVSPDPRNDPYLEAAHLPY